MMLGLSAFTIVLFAAQGASPGGRITGQVTDALSGTPIAGARVTLLMVVDVPGGTFGRRPRQSITDANGAFAFDGVEPAQYTVSVEKTGFASYPDVFGDGPPERLTVNANHVDPQLQIALKKGAVIVGRILNAAGEPEAHLQVSALKRTDKIGPIGFAQVGNAQTNDLGEFRIAGLPSGDYRIVAAAQRHGSFDAIETGAMTLAPTFFPGTLDQNAASIVTLVPGQAVTGMEFTIVTVAAFRVSGVVVDQAGRPSPDAMVTLIPDIRTSGSFMPMMAMAADDGTFEIGQVIPGTYRINANANERGAGSGIGAISFGIASDDTRSGPGTITVGAADMTGLRVVASSR
jgi:protocatechuate 3,4-dioxygenase beta subunit